MRCFDLIARSLGTYQVNSIYEGPAGSWGDLLNRRDLSGVVCSAIALQSGVDIRTVSGMLGHADPGFTLRTYTHVTNPMQVKAAETVGNVIGSKL